MRGDKKRKNLPGFPLRGNMVRHSGDDHMFETEGECHAKIRHGQVVEIGKPRIKGCPLAKRFEIASAFACWGCHGRLPGPLPGPLERVLLWTRMQGSVGR
jgi:hypothetical protein